MELVNNKQRRIQNVCSQDKKCPYCGFESELPHVFKLHTNSIRICTVCNETFCGVRSAQNFNLHQNKHIVKPKKIRDCKICNKSFKYPSEVKNHYRVSVCGRQVDY